MTGDTQRRGRVRAVVAVSALVFLPTTGLAAQLIAKALGRIHIGQGTID